ncbi:hypothetical protein [Parafilimonas terrae]|jgi:hypothetical protein|uniref:Uncharacterized protein n=1 Tax=Parafilimonas terrae TaxID=1465490 RepID=A0A1I5TRN7_9BACT|nr:hypothetical protein [Parafilimonas terrae]SFP85729.1 hypothetical protein SAMN05444277_102270 [Parafilimonas terrae]
MKLFIDKESRVGDVKKIFTSCYPFLKIELYKKSFANNFIAVKKEPLAATVRINEFMHAANEIVIDISHNVTVAELESQFDDIGFITEVFRKSGNVWIASSLTDNWTLQQQNAEGKEISSHF